MSGRSKIDIMGGVAHLRLPKPKRLERNTFRYTAPDESVRVRLHDTDIIIVRDGGIIELNNGGYDSVTTRARINTHAKGVSCYRRAGVTYVNGVAWFGRTMTLRYGKPKLTPEQKREIHRELKARSAAYRKQCRKVAAERRAFKQTQESLRWPAGFYAVHKAALTSARRKQSRNKESNHV